MYWGGGESVVLYPRAGTRPPDGLQRHRTLLDRRYCIGPGRASTQSSRGPLSLTLPSAAARVTLTLSTRVTSLVSMVSREQDGDG